MSPDLEFVETQVLVEELSRRFDHFVLMGFRVNEHGDEYHGYVKRWKGNSHTCMGLCQDLSVSVREDLYRGMAEVDMSQGEVKP